MPFLPHLHRPVDQRSGMDTGRVTDLGRGRGAAGPGAMGAAEEPSVDLDAMPDDAARAVLTDRRQPLDGALERVEGVNLPGRVYLERHPVVVSANLACGHSVSLRPLTARSNRNAK